MNNKLNKLLILAAITIVFASCSTTNPTQLPTEESDTIIYQETIEIYNGEKNNTISKKGSKIYLNGVAQEEIDADSFKLAREDLDLPVFTDKNAIYLYRDTELVRIEGMDVKSLNIHRVNDTFTYIYDKNTVFRIAINEYNTEINSIKLDSLDIAIQGMYIMDSESVFYGAKEVEGVDRQSFILLDTNKMKDKNNVYIGAYKVPELDAQTTYWDPVLEALYDENQVINSEIDLDYSVLASQTSNNKSCFPKHIVMDSKGIYDKGIFLSPYTNIDLSSVEFLAESYSGFIFRDKDFYYHILASESSSYCSEFVKKIENTGQDFKYIGGDYIMLENDIFYQLDKIEDFEQDQDSFEVIFNDVIKNKNNLYFQNRIIEGADPVTFTVIKNNTADKARYYKDKNNVYYKGEKIVGADSGTFELNNYHNCRSKIDFPKKSFYKSVHAKDKAAYYHRGERYDFIECDLKITENPKKIQNNEKLKQNAHIVQLLDKDYTANQITQYYKPRHTVLAGVSPEGSCISSVNADETGVYYGDVKLLPIFNDNVEVLYDNNELIYLRNNEFMFQLQPGYKCTIGIIPFKLNTKDIEVLDQNYFLINNQVYVYHIHHSQADQYNYKTNKDLLTIDNIDLESFEIFTQYPFNNYYSKDKNHAYYLNQILPNADPITFQVLKESNCRTKDNIPLYALDKNNFYMEDNVFPKEEVTCIH